MTTKSKNKNNSTVISVRTDKETSDRLSRLASNTERSRSALIDEALGQYVAHQDWLAAEIQRGIEAADRGELVSDAEIASWIKSLK